MTGAADLLRTGSGRPRAIYCRTRRAADDRRHKRRARLDAHADRRRGDGPDRGGVARAAASERCRIAEMWRAASRLSDDAANHGADRERRAGARDRHTTERHSCSRPRAPRRCGLGAPEGALPTGGAVHARDASPARRRLRRREKEHEHDRVNGAERALEVADRRPSARRVGVADGTRGRRQGSRAKRGACGSGWGTTAIAHGMQSRYPRAQGGIASCPRTPDTQDDQTRDRQGGVALRSRWFVGHRRSLS